MKLNVNLNNSTISMEEMQACRGDAGRALDRLWSGVEPMTGWVTLPAGDYSEMLEHILNLSDAIKNQAELLVVIGVGGSYLGAKAAIEALPKTEGGIQVRFLGNNFCTDYYWETIEEIKKKKTMVCVISKSGNTMEVMTAFEIVKPLLVDKYGSEEEAAKKIVVITDETKGALRQEANEKGYTAMSIDENIGGRYSVMTPAGLLPMAVCGIDIRSFLDGARDCANSPEWDLGLTDYGIVRYLLQKKGKEVEFIEMCQSRLEYLGEWIRQLYGESEGKEGKGLLPTILTLSTDLHSMGQYLQEGRQIFMETLIVVDEPSTEIKVPAGPQSGMTIKELNDAVVKGVIEAHSSEGIPIVEIHIPKLDAYYYGQLIYYLETTCAVTAMLTGVNPFDQPGVERYKEEMRSLLKK